MAEGNDSAKSAVEFADIKTVAEMSAWAAGQSMLNQVAHQNRLNIVAESLITQAAKGVTEVTPTEAMSVLKTLSGHDLAQQLAALVSAMNAKKVTE